MIEVSEKTLATIHRSLPPSPFSAEVRSVTAGNSPGWVFDHAERHESSIHTE